MGCPMLGRYRWRLVLVEVIEGRLVRQGEVFADQERRVAPLLRLPHIVHPGGTRKSPYSTEASAFAGSLQVAKRPSLERVMDFGEISCRTRTYRQFSFATAGRFPQENQ